MSLAEEVAKRVGKHHRPSQLLGLRPAAAAANTAAAATQVAAGGRQIYRAGSTASDLKRSFEFRNVRFGL